MSLDVSLEQRAARLRDEFDRAFAHEPALTGEGVENFLQIRIGADGYVLRLGDVAGLFVDKTVTWLPSPVPELLGIAGFRGVVLPVYDLGALLGYPRAGTPRWLLRAAGAPIALAFEGFDGYLHLTAATVLPQAHARRDHVRETLRTDVTRPIIHVPSVLDTIKERIGRERPI